MISTVVLDGHEHLWPIAYISGADKVAIEAELVQLKEKLSDMAVEKLREGADEEERTHTHKETPDEPCDACDLDRRLIAARTELEGMMRLAWDDLPTITAGARDPEDEGPIFGHIEEKLEYVNGVGISELGYL